MRTVLFFAFCFFVVPVFCQDLDSLAVVREVDSLIQTSRNFINQRNYSKALEVNAVTEKIILEKSGRMSAAYGSCCSVYGLTYFYQRNYPEAEKWLLEAKSIRVKVLGKEHVTYSNTLHLLAVVYSQMGHYEKAVPLYLEAIAIRSKVLGEEHDELLNSMGNLGIVYNYMGIYEKAEQMHLKCKSILEKTKGKEHPDYAIALNSLANVYVNMGYTEKAEPIFLEANALAKKTMGEEHMQHLRGLGNLAVLYYKAGDFEKAEHVINEAKTIWERKSGGREHPDYAATLNLLGNIFMDKSDYKKAEQYYLEANVISEKAFGKDHPKIAVNLNNLGILFMKIGNYEKAEHLFLESMAIRKKVLGTESSEYIWGLDLLAGLYEREKRFEESERLLTNYLNLYQSRISESTSFLSELDLTSYASIFIEGGNNLYTYLLNRSIESQSGGLLPDLGFNYTLFHKGFLLTAARRLNTLSTYSLEARELNNRLKEDRRRLATEYSKPIADRKAVGELEDKANTSEKELIRSVAGYARDVRQIKWQEVQSALKPDEAAIEFVHFQVNFPKNTDSTMYAALLLLPGAEQPRFIPLFEEKSLDSLLLTQGERRADYVNTLYTIAERGATPLGKPQKTLYGLLWKPLEEKLAGVNTIYYSPSGLLHRLNLAAMPINLDSVLGDQYNLVELGSTRQLVVPTTIKPAANDAVLFGGITYDSDSTAMSQANTTLDTITIASRGELSFTYTDSTLRVGTWSALPYTAREVGSVEKTLKAAGFQTGARRGYAATEEVFKSAGAGGKPSPRVLHIATHGYFFPDPQTSARFQTSPTFAAAEPVFKLSDHPMIRSGLLLAGANHAWATGKPMRPGMEDGILTAYEIAQMNLSNTELVVLSACETGLGDIQGNEGVYGLQRAFKIAGAKYLIMSLWQVPDKQTSLLMTTFYKKWLEEKMAIPEAFRAAQKELREAELDPYYWAGFVLVE